MELDVRVFATLRRVVGQKTLRVELPEGATLQTLVDHVIERFPRLAELMLDENGELSRSIHVFVDGRSSKYLPNGLATTVEPHLLIEFFPAVAGGAH